MKRSISRVAMAIALSLGAVGMVSVATPAVAAKKKAAGKYSKEFIEAYQPIAKASEGEDVSALKAQIPGLAALIASPDEKLAGGQLIFNIGSKLKDQALQYQGLTMMLDSGLLGEDNVGNVTLEAGQLAYNLKDMNAARTYLEAAKQLMPTNADIAAPLAETYVQTNDFDKALALIDDGMKARTAAGLAPDDALAFRGLAIAANNQLKPQALVWAGKVLESNPRPEFRAEAYKVLASLSTFTKDEELDLLRLMDRDNGLSNRIQFMAYLEGADARRRPAEVQDLIEQGLSAGVLTTGGLVSDELAVAKQRYASTLKEINADSPKSTGNPAAAIADVYLGYGKPAEAEAMYRKALASGATNKDQVMTGLGIALADQGKFAEAKSTFEQISVGNRGKLAKMWIAYVDRKMAG